MEHTKEHLQDEVKRLTSLLAEKDKELIKAKHLLTDVHERMSDAHYVIDLNWRFVHVNQKFMQYVQKSSEELIGKELFEIFPQFHKSEAHINYLKVMRTLKPVQFEAICEYTTRTHLCKAFPHNGGICVYLSDFTEQRKAEMGLCESNETIHHILESITDAFFAVNEDWLITYVNHFAEKIYGFRRESILNCNYWDIFKNAVGSELYSKFFQAVDEQVPLSFITPSSYRSDLILEVNLFPTRKGLYIFFRDITEKLRIEKEMLRLNNLHLIGELSAGISHEVRNPMTTVRGFLQILSRKPEYAKDLVFFDLMIGEIDRANSIITEFLSLAKDKPVRLQPGNLNEKIEAVYPLILADALESEKNVRLQLESIPMTLLDENEIRQLSLNLVRNGLEAMSPGGTLTISTTFDGEYCILSIQDEGEGIPPQIMEKLGTPFITTKDHGTGLGLAISYSIVNRHRGILEVKSSPEGTIVCVKLKGT
jgi:two-component system, sporulation sensor kinase E